MGRKLAISLLGVLLWVLMIHTGSLTTATIIRGKYGYLQSAVKYASANYRNTDTPTIKPEDLNDAVQFGETLVNRMERLETNLGWANIFVKPGTAAHGYLIESSASDEALQLGRTATIALKASGHLRNIFCTSPSDETQCAKQLTKYNISATSLGDVCTEMKHKCTSEEITAKYRSLDGSCNNIVHSSRGKALTQYKRLLYPAYCDGVSAIRRSSNNKPLPSARLVSTQVLDNVNYLDSQVTLAFMVWMQFMEHDLAHTASSRMISTKNSIICCDKWGYNLAPRYKHPFCLPVSIPSNDSFYSQYGSNCMSYVRSLPAVREDCSFGPNEQMDLATHYLDASHIYGTTEPEALNLRGLRGGRLLVSSINEKEFLPLSQTPIDDCQVSLNNADCYKSGDSRVNLHPHITAMYAFWWREHNRIAEQLENLNPEWDDEILYHEARRIVIAEIQHITYTEWLPTMFGSQPIDMNEQYNKNVNPSVSNAFATAALRFVNSLMEANLNVYEENRVANITLRLQDHFNNPLVFAKPDYLDGLIRGLATQRSGKLDLNFVSDVTEQMYKYGKYGFDAFSLDIQRGRDHGLPSYTQYREICGLRPANTFEDLSDVIPQEGIESLRSVYGSPKDIDLIVGGMAELPEKNSIVGPTFSCIILEQLHRTKIGDRYFYNHKHFHGFTPEQLHELKKASLARIFCDNGDNIKRMQRNVMTTINDKNKLMSCDDDRIPRINLSAWKETNKSQL